MSILSSEFIYIAVSSGAGVLIGSIPILIDYAKSQWKKRFREQIKSGIINKI